MMRLKKMTLGEVSRYRQMIYGFAALWIMLFHMQREIPSGALLAPLAWLKKNGSCGVDIFVLMTGFGLYRSLNREPKLSAFYAKRLSRVALPAAVTSAVYFGLQHGGILEYAGIITFISYWLGGQAFWYVPFILAAYAVYPALHALQKRRPGALWILLALSVGVVFAAPIIAPEAASWYRPAINRVPVFLLGCILAPAVDADREIPHWAAPAALAAHILLVICHELFGPMDFFFVSLSYIFLAAFLVLALAWLAGILRRAAPGRALCRILSFYGDISLEIYMIYSCMLRLLNNLGYFARPDISPIKQELVCILLSTLLSLLLQTLCQSMREAWKRTGAAFGE